MYEINVEIFHEKAYVRIGDLIALCERSKSKLNTPYNLALEQIKLELQRLEQDALSQTEDQIL